MNRREEALLREWIREELASERLDEGALDMLKSFVKKLALSADVKLDAVLKDLRGKKDEAEKLTKIVRNAEGGTKVVSAISKLGNEFSAASEQVEQLDIKPPAKKKDATSEAALRAAVPILLELNGEFTRSPGRRRLDEVGVFEVVGLGLGLIGGIPLALKSLYKIAKLFKMGGAADFLKSMYEKAHHMEQGFVNFVIPDKISYAIYTKYNEVRHPEKVANYKVWAAEPESELSKRISQDKRILSPGEYEGSETKERLEKGLYILLLTPWLINGIVALKNFVSNVINWAEGAATAVKGVEATELASMASELIQGGAANLDDAAVAVSAAVDAIDDIAGMS